MFSLRYRDLLVHPLDELITVDHHSLADENGWEAFAAHQGVCSGTGDAENGCKLVRFEGDRKLIERGVSRGCVCVFVGRIRTPFKGEMWTI